MIRGLRIRVRGQVQGVGFRPFVWGLCDGMGLRGRVLNDPEGVLIEAAGPGAETLPARLREGLPPLARVDGVEPSEVWFKTLPKGFVIARSEGMGSQTRIAPDTATCADCLAEVRDPADRRFGYPFANCTNCGPRFTIIEGVPYDRARTTMAGFALCPDCKAEYDSPADRRFHAQPVACATCGPRAWFETGGAEVPGDAVTLAAAALRQGQIVAIKGLGGFHLAVRADDPDAIARLRRRKHRPSKPLALMGTLEMIRQSHPLTDAEEALLTDPAAPIVLVPGRGPLGVAPGQATVGWMLPYTPLHHLLLDAVGGALVMTSGNLSGAPQAIDNTEARDTLGTFADGFLMHDRPIARRLDDSVERADPPMVLRRARGRVPGTVPVPPGFEACPPITAYGGQMKGAICLLKDGQALLGHHLGDLDDALSYDAFLQADRDYAEIFDHKPARVACDLHPEFAATRHAHSLGLAVTEVQHHHAHMAACLGENLWPLNGGAVAGIVLDGLGLGPDGTIWGGELLLGGYTGIERRAWLTPAPLIGGDRAQAEPWRNALVRLDAAGLGDWADALFPDVPRAVARQVAAQRTHAPLSSSAGRLFDAVAACLGICANGQSHEGEAAMRLEALAAEAAPDEAAGAYPFGRNGTHIDPAPIWPLIARDVANGVPPEAVSLRFHAGLAQAFAAPARALIESGDAQAVALSGGCFQNAVLHRLMVVALGDVPVLTHRITPANDGGLAFGQALVAAARALEAE